MSATVTVGAAAGTNPTVYPCTVGSATFSVVVSAQTLAAVPSDEQSSYVQARALLASGDASGATDIVTPYATGSAGPPDTRNWAAKWLAGQILS